METDKETDKLRRRARWGTALSGAAILTALFGGNYLRREHSYLIGLILPAAGLLALVLGGAIVRGASHLPHSSRRRQISAFLLVLLLAAAVSEFSIVAPIERVHFLKYGSLSFFLFFSCYSQRAPRARLLARTLGIAMAAGILEECAQHFLPGRVFDLRDISLNLSGAILGALLAVVTAYPLGENRPAE